MIGIIGGSGLSALPGLEVIEQTQLDTPFGEPSAPLISGRLDGRKVVFLPRHGEHHTIPPHLINYRANGWALHHLGVRQVLAVAAVGGIKSTLVPGSLVIPDQLMDYTWGRESSVFSELFSAEKHIDFTWPYDAGLRQTVLAAAVEADLPIFDGGTYAVTQGPRLETSAEIRRLANDGATMVGMTAMPEAAIARELEMHYVTIAVVANFAAGLGDAPLTMQQISDTLKLAIGDVKRLLIETIKRLA